MNRDSNINIIEKLPNAPASPASVDWRGKGVVTSVKNQGNCGSCWSFSTTGVLEGTIAMKNKTLADLSQQQLVDCCSYSKYGCEGCSGAWPEWALEYVRDNGIMLDKDYPYEGVQNKCKDTSSAKKILDHKKAWSMLSNNTNNTELVRQSLATLGPLSICVDAYQWQFYTTGIYNNCHDGELDHAVLLVGYQEDGVWIVKNSWSDQWGEQGYIRVAPKGTACLIRSHVIVPHLAA